jgi:hypothetical protein
MSPTTEASARSRKLQAVRMSPLNLSNHTSNCLLKCRVFPKSQGSPRRRKLCRPITTVLPFSRAPSLPWRSPCSQPPVPANSSSVGAKEPSPRREPWETGKSHQAPVRGERCQRARKQARSLRIQSSAGAKERSPRRKPWETREPHQAPVRGEAPKERKNVAHGVSRGKPANPIKPRYGAKGANDRNQETPCAIHTNIVKFFVGIGKT